MTLFEFIVIIWLAALSGGFIGLFIALKIEHNLIIKEFIELYSHLTKEFKDVYDRMSILMDLMRRK